MTRMCAVVERRDADHLVADARSAGRVEAVRAAVADRRDDDHARRRPARRRRGGRVLRPVVERVADRHVQDVHAVGERALHRREHDVVRGRAVAAEDAVGAELDARGDAPPVARAPLAPTMPATCVPWPLQSSGSGPAVGRRRVRRAGSDSLGVVRIPDEVPARDHAAAREVVVEAAVVAVRVGVDAVAAEDADGRSRCPVSITATFTPAPVSPSSFWAMSAPVMRDGRREVGIGRRGRGNAISRTGQTALTPSELPERSGRARRRGDRDAVPERVERERSV